MNVIITLYHWLEKIQANHLKKTAERINRGVYGEAASKALDSLRR